MKSANEYAIIAVIVFISFAIGYSSPGKGFSKVESEAYYLSINNADGSAEHHRCTEVTDADTTNELNMKAYIERKEAEEGLIEKLENIIRLEMQRGEIEL